MPTSLKVFLAALAILDDLGAVTIIAFFYSSGLNLPMLAAAFVTLAVLIVLNRLNVRRLLPYLLCGIGFTMSLFIGNLAFPGEQHLIDEVKVGVLIGSGLAAIAGIVLLRSRFSRH